MISVITLLQNQSTHLKRSTTRKLNQLQQPFNFAHISSAALRRLVNTKDRKKRKSLVRLPTRGFMRQWCGRSWKAKGGWLIAHSPHWKPINSRESYNVPSTPTVICPHITCGLLARQTQHPRNSSGFCKGTIKTAVLIHLVDFRALGKNKTKQITTTKNNRVHISQPQPEKKKWAEEN